MKNLMLIFMIPAFIVGCVRCDKPKNTVIKINNYEISKAEFEEEFKDSNFARDDTLQSRKDFLDNLVDRILILQDAQKNGLDNDPQFLKMVEKFWMHSLLRLAIEKKSKEISGFSLGSGDTAKLKESSLMNDWLTQLHKDANIQLNKDLISKDK